MYAVIRSGGKQQKVKAGDVIEIELRKGHEDGDLTFTPLLVVDDDGTTHHGRDAARATVRGRLVGEQKGEKVRVFKYKSKTGYSRRQGHRQTYALVEIQDVSLGGERRGSQRASAKPPVSEEAAGDVAGAAAGAAPGETVQESVGEQPEVAEEPVTEPGS